MCQRFCHDKVTVDHRVVYQVIKPVVMVFIFHTLYLVHICKGLAECLQVLKPLKGLVAKPISCHSPQKCQSCPQKPLAPAHCNWVEYWGKCQKCSLVKRIKRRQCVVILRVGLWLGHLSAWSRLGCLISVLQLILGQDEKSCNCHNCVAWMLLH